MPCVPDLEGCKETSPPTFRLPQWPLILKSNNPLLHTNLTLHAFPVNVGPNASIQPWIPTPPHCLTFQAAGESGPDSLYLEQVLTQWAINLQTHYDWYTLLKACLDPPAFLQWRAAYDDMAEGQAHTNIQYQLPITLDMLTGHGNFIDPVSHSLIGIPQYFVQVKDMALQSLKSCTPPKT